MAALTEATHDIVERLHRENMHDALLSVREAALYAGVTPDRVRQWKRRGHLAPAGLDIFGRPLFLAIDVLRAWTAAERRLAATQAPLVATRRASSQS